MRRPALSASRAIQIINRLAANPRRSFTMSEIMRDTDINVGSCHALLTVLTESGFLHRSNEKKTYTLGPVLAAVGQSAFESQSLISHARVEALALMARIGRPVLLTAAVGEEIVVIFSLDDASGGDRLRVGHRVPFAPPLGAPFVAWSTDETIDEWFSRTGHVDDEVLSDWRHALRIVKQRGYQVTLRPPDPELSMLMGDIAQGRAPLTIQQEWLRYFETGDRRLLQPDTIEPDGSYPVVLIAAPVFDDTSGDIYCLGITGFAGNVSGADIEIMARQLLQSCVTIMRERDQ